MYKELIPTDLKIVVLESKPDDDVWYIDGVPHPEIHPSSCFYDRPGFYYATILCGTLIERLVRKSADD